MNPFILTVLLFLGLNTSSAWHFFLTEGKTRCIYEELPKNEVIRLDMHLLDAVNSEPGSGILVHVSQIKTETVIQEKFVPFLTPTKLSFLCETGGAYEICATTTTPSHWIAPNQRVRFELRVVYEIDQTFTEKQHEDVVDNKRFDALYSTLRKLHSKSMHLVNIQDANREKEISLFEENNAIKDKIVFCTMFQIAVILISGIFQICSIRAFLIKKNLY